MFIGGASEGDLLDAIAASIVPDMLPGDVSITLLAEHLGVTYDTAKRHFYDFAAANKDSVIITDAHDPKTGKVVKVMRRK